MRSTVKDKSIFIRNIYYMLAYAFQVLRQNNYEEIAGEAFEQTADLFAAILGKGVAQQLKHGLYREYRARTDSLTVLRGRLDLQGTVRHRVRREQKLSCEFDELTENNLFNQILKTAMLYLIQNDEVAYERKSVLRGELFFFRDIDQLPPGQIPWNRLYYQRNNKNYEMLMNLCYFILDGMLQTAEEGSHKMAAFSDKHMARLYERFILEYYRQEHPWLTDVRAAQVKWNLVGETDASVLRFLPEMQTDTMLRLGEKVLIIDAKYYGRILQRQYEKDTLHSGNLYQIFTYVKNQDSGGTGNVSGLLLYAKTDEDVAPDGVFNMGGNRVGVRTLDLNADFPHIAAQLDRILEDFFEVPAASCKTGWGRGLP